MFANIRADFGRYYRYVEGANWKIRFRYCFFFVFTQAIWAIVTYRYGAWCRKLKIPILGPLLRITYFFLNKFIEIITGISISSNAEIGKGLYIGHFGGIFIHPNTTLGENCNIGQGVTIGTLGLGKKGVPRIGNGVFIGAGAKVLGEIKIGDNVRIGANAVVLKDVPDNATVVGVPAKIVKICSVKKDF